MSIPMSRYFGFNSSQERTLRALFDADVFTAGAVGTAELATGAVTTAKLASSAVTNAKVDAAAAIAATKLAVAAGTNGLSAANLQVALQALNDYAVNLNSWAVIIAGKMNTLAAKLNADAGVTDTNYAINFDTDPQS